jgi:MFS family permease
LKLDSFLAFLTQIFKGELVWSLNVQDMLFSATFFGALITTLPAGYIAQRTSPKAILLITALNYIILTAIFPLVVKNATHHLVFAVRFLMGIGEVIFYTGNYKNANVLQFRDLFNQLLIH